MKTLSAGTIAELTEWAQEVVDELAKKREYSAYEVRLTLTPNPINYDGIDQVKIELYDKNSRFHNIRNSLSFNLKDALHEIHKNLMRY